MRVLSGVASAAVFLLAGIASAESVTWEATAVNGTGKREHVGGGVREYSPAKDIAVREGKGRGGAPTWTKALVLDDMFALSASVYREASLDGFGLFIYRRGDANGFSWEWFDREDGDVFLKRQGSGRLSVRVKKGADFEELESAEFLDDIILQYLDDMAKPPGTHTHEVLIRKGSVFSVAP